jgi:hypothetical protein
MYSNRVPRTNTTSPHAWSPRRSAALTLAVLLLAACGAPRPPAGHGFTRHDDGAGLPVDAPYGVWNRARDPADARAEIEALEAIGYLDGSVSASGLPAGVTRHDPARAHAGLNFYCSGHAPEAVLMDMAGNPLHTWRHALDTVWPDYPFREDSPKTGYWRRAHLLPDGSVLAIFEGIGIIKVDRDSRLLWARRNGAHHDLEVLPDGRIWVLTRTAHVLPAVHPERPVLEDFLTLLDGDGNTLDQFSLLEAHERGASRDQAWALMQPHGDVYHANSVEVIDARLAGRAPGFEAGHLLVSLLYPNLVSVVDPAARRVTWSAAGSWKRQHHPTATADGRMLIFDNRGAGQASRIVALDPADNAESVAYAGTEADPFYTWACGAVYPLPNGNLLIVESDRGRAFEAAPGGDIVWEFLNPHRAGDGGQYIAALFDLVRVPADAVNPPLGPAPAP